MSSKFRSASLIALTFTICALVAGTWRTVAFAAPQEDEGDVQRSIRRFANLLDVVEKNYADEVDASRAVYQGAIPNMLRSLDPHSQFFDPDAYEQLRDEQRGQYAGVGMQITERDGAVVVVHPFPRTPAYRAGLRPGDIIAEIDGAATTGYSSSEVAGKLRGVPGTTVEVGVERRGHTELIRVSLQRAEIPRKSLKVAFELKDRIGFVRIEQFNETTGKELDTALAELDLESIEGLILDLRDNRGGLLSEGVRVSDRFLERGQTIVSHHGRASREQVYKARQGNQGRTFPMVVMVNCNSASASEIVAGALQDHDRALVAGAPTFGKGLVQTVFPLNEGGGRGRAGLALTTARYYTPSGRLIQREYDEVSLIDYYNDPCSDRYQPSNSEVKSTDQGRVVYGGGGITPDIRLETEERSDLHVDLLFRYWAYASFAQKYTLENPNLPDDWEPDQQVINEFRVFLYEEKVPFEEAAFTEDLETIRRSIKREIYVSAFDVEVGDQVYYALDPQVQAALDLLPKAGELLKLSEDGSKRLVAENR